MTAYRTGTAYAAGETIKPRMAQKVNLTRGRIVNWNGFQSGKMINLKLNFASPEQMQERTSVQVKREKGISK